MIETDKVISPFDFDISLVDNDRITAETSRDATCLVDASP